MQRLAASVFAPAAGMFLLVGCAATPIVPTDVATTGMASPDLALRRAIDSVNASMTVIGQMRPAPVASYGQAAATLPDDLHRSMRFVWSGTLDAGVSRLGATIGYHVDIVTSPQARPLLVAVNLDTQAVSILAAMGDQAGAGATVEVDPVHQSIRVTHHV